MNSTVSTILDRIQTEFKCRNVQIQQIFHYLNLPNHHTHNVVVYGPRATGKSSIVRRIMTEFQVAHVWIEALYYTSSKVVYESILRQVADLISGFYINDLTIVNRDFRCQNSVVFFEKLTLLLEKFTEYVEDHSAMLNDPYERKFCIVFDNFENLIKNDNQDLAYVFKNLVSLMQATCPITVFYIGSHSSEWLGRNYDFDMSCFQVPFNNYANEELLEILSVLPPANMEYPPEFYANYVNIILKALIPFTKNFVELQDICMRHFAAYAEPVVLDEFSYKESGKLYMRFQNRLQELVESIADHKIVRRKATAELSPSMSYLLIACYLASHNSLKSDKKHFVKNQGKTRERKKLNKKTVDIEAIPPKAFIFERLFNIYQALLNLNEMDNERRIPLMMESVVFAQFNELIKQNLVSPSKLAVNSLSISSKNKYVLSDFITTKYIQEVATKVHLCMKAFSEVL